MLPLNTPDIMARLSTASRRIVQPVAIATLGGNTLNSRFSCAKVLHEIELLIQRKPRAQGPTSIRRKRPAPFKAGRKIV
jgi:hypothetical protein